MAKMLGESCPEGPGGRDCCCCGQPPGKARKIQRRTIKRGKAENSWKTEEN